MDSVHEVVLAHAVAHQEDLDLLVPQSQRIGEPEGVVRTLAAVRRRVHDEQDRHLHSSPTCAVRIGRRCFAGRDR